MQLQKDKDKFELQQRHQMMQQRQNDAHATLPRAVLQLQASAAAS
jgi:hypothetical protein